MKKGCNIFYFSKSNSRTEVFVPPSDEKPVGLPVRKLEGPIQATGEAVFPVSSPCFVKVQDNFSSSIGIASPMRS